MNKLIKKKDLFEPSETYVLGIPKTKVTKTKNIRSEDDTGGYTEINFDESKFQKFVKPGEYFISKGCNSFQEYILNNPDNINPDLTISCFKVNSKTGKLDYISMGNFNSKNNQLGELIPKPVIQETNQTQIFSDVLNKVLERESNVSAKEREMLDTYFKNMLTSKDNQITDLKTQLQSMQESILKMQSSAGEVSPFISEVMANLQTDKKALQEDIEYIRDEYKEQIISLNEIIKELNIQISNEKSEKSIIQAELNALKSYNEKEKEQEKAFNERMSGLEQEAAEIKQNNIQGLMTLLTPLVPLFAPILETAGKAFQAKIENKKQEQISQRQIDYRNPDNYYNHSMQFNKMPPTNNNQPPQTEQNNPPDYYNEQYYNELLPGQQYPQQQQNEIPVDEDFNPNEFNRNWDGRQ